MWANACKNCCQNSARFGSSLAKSARGLDGAELPEAGAGEVEVEVHEGGREAAGHGAGPGHEQLGPREGPRVRD